MSSRAEYSARPGRESLSKRLGKLARRIKARDGHRCQYCSATAESSGSALHLDHLVPRSAGGEDTAENLVLACRSCNCARHDMPLAQWVRVAGLSRTARQIRAQAARVLPEVA
jgi:5-methylcytosine-specific restriction endonuclease McrA